jgi:hypothetical protein
VESSLVAGQHTCLVLFIVVVRVSAVDASRLKDLFSMVLGLLRGVWV